MTDSNIDPSANSYNPFYPQAGVNQSSQGFRDNFTSIQNNLTIARDEISAIHSTAIAVGGSNADIINLDPLTFFDWRSGSLKLRLVDNIQLRGTSGVRVPVGSTSNRPATSGSINGMIRYNQDSNRNCFELGVNGTWISLGLNESQYVARAGDYMAGTLTMGSGSTASGSRLLLDFGTNTTSPVLGFRGPNGAARDGIGLNANTDGSSLYLVVGSKNRLTIQNERNITIGSSTLTLDSRALFSDPNTNTHTQVWAQRVGYVYTKEFYLDIGTEASPLQGIIPSQTDPDAGWYTIIRADLNSISASGIRGGFNCNFMVSSANSGEFGFSLVGNLNASFIVTTGGRFVSQRPMVNLQSTIYDIESANVEFRVISDVGFDINPHSISLQIRCVNNRVTSDSTAIPYLFRGICTSHQTTSNDRYTLTPGP